MAKAIDYFAYDNAFIKVKTYFSLKARKKMYSYFADACRPKDTDEVLDLGATPDVKLADSNFFEKLYPYKDKITVASIEDCSELVASYGLKEFRFNEPHKALPFEDGTFDIVFSSAVLEHVGTREDQEFFINECLRILKPDGRIFITTPNRYFPVEMHTFFVFLHWLPWNVFQKIVRVFKGEFWADINNLNLVSSKDIYAMTLNSRVKVDYIKTCGLKSNIIITRE